MDIGKLTIEEIERIKSEYGEKMKQQPDNNINKCIQLVASAAVTKDSTQRTKIAIQLSSMLAQPKGLLELFLALIDFDPTSQKSTTLNQRFIAIATLIARMPHLSMPFGEYCQKLSQQLVPLLLSDKTTYSTLASIIIKALIDNARFHSSDSKSIAIILLEPIKLSITTPMQLISCDMKTTPPLNLQDSITIIYHLTIVRVPLPHLMDITPHLFYAFCHLHPTRSHLKAMLLETLTVMISSSLTPAASSYFIDRIVFHQQNVYHLYKLKAHTDSIGIDFAGNKPDDETETSDQHTLIASAVSSIIENLDRKFRLELFFHFLRKQSQGNNSYVKGLSALVLKQLLYSAEEGRVNHEIYESIIEDKGRSFYLIATILDRYNVGSDSSKNVDRIDHNLGGEELDLKYRKPAKLQSVVICLDILDVLINHSSEKELSAFRRHCLPILNKIKDVDIEASDDTDKKIVIEVKEKLNEFQRILVNSFTNDEVKSGIKESSRRELESIMKDLNDELVPTRVHSLVKIKHMIQARDEVLLDQFNYMLNVITASLTEEDPYVFLAAINALSAMANYKTDLVLPHLIRLYEDEDLPIQSRLNVGETVVKLTKELGQMAPAYSPQLMHLFFVGCKHPEEIIRVSSLSNIGEIGSQLKDSLGNYIVEILSCIKPLLETDTIQVKRAAVSLLRCMLAGVDRRRFESVQRDLVSIYRILKKLRDTVLDDVLNVQVDLTLDEVSRIVKELLTPASSDNASLIKNIQVLNLGQ